MATGELGSGCRPVGPLLRELENHGCTLTIVDGPTTTGRLSMHVLFPEDEYLEKKCRRLLDDWRGGGLTRR